MISFQYFLLGSIWLLWHKCQILTSVTDPHSGETKVGGKYAKNGVSKDASDLKLG